MSYLLCGDVSGTNTRLFVCNMNSLVIENLMEYKTQEIEDFPKLVNDFMNQLSCSPTIALFAGAGPKTNDAIHLSNSPLVLDSYALEQKTPLRSVYLINDIEVIAYGLSYVGEENKKVLSPHQNLHPSLVLGVGTGFGGGVFDNNMYANKEVGHQEIPFEDEIITFGKKILDKDTLLWEDLISGKGIELLFYYTSGYEEEVENFSQNSGDFDVKKAYERFFYYLALAVEDFVVKYNCFQVYIAGGVISKSIDFLDEESFLEVMGYNVGVTLILDYDVSLYGLTHYMSK